jgi:hypothetical protein
VLHAARAFSGKVGTGFSHKMRQDQNIGRFAFLSRPQDPGEGGVTVPNFGYYRVPTSNPSSLHGRSPWPS